MSNDIKAAQKKLSDRVMGKPGISGTAIGMNAGAPCLTVYVSTSEAGRSVPKRVDGFAVVVENSGTFRRL